MLAAFSDRTFGYDLFFGWDTMVPMETPLAVLWLCRTLYPEGLAAIDMKQEVKSFYKEFFFYELSDDMY